MISTTTDNMSMGWEINDEVVQLRLWAADRVYPLPTLPDGARLVVDTAATCAIQVTDASKFASREHACLEREDGRWTIVDQRTRRASRGASRMG